MIDSQAWDVWRGWLSVAPQLLDGSRHGFAFHYDQTDNRKAHTPPPHPAWRGFSIPLIDNVRCGWRDPACRGDKRGKHDREHGPLGSSTLARG